MNAVMNIRVQLNEKCFLTSRESMSLSRETLAHGVIYLWDPIMCALSVCTSNAFCIWPDDGSMSRNMSPNL